MRQCIFVIGTRAQLVKVAPVLSLASQSGLQHVVWFTGQHDESIDDLIDDFDIQSDFIRPQQRTERSSVFRLVTWLPGTLLRCFRFVRSVRDRTQSAPLVVVHGDTLSTWLGAVAGRLAAEHGAALPNHGRAIDVLRYNAPMIVPLIFSGFST